MPLISDPQTRQALVNLGCLKGVDRLDGSQFAGHLARRLETHHNAADLSDVDRVEVTVGQLVTDVIGHHDDGLIELVQTAGLLGVNADSPVQKALDAAGLVLCARRHTVSVVINGDPRNVSVATRFATAADPVLAEHVFGPAHRQMENLLRRTLAKAELVEARQPGMSAAVAQFRADLSALANNVLTAGTVTP